jgi:hypothetical protein
LWLLSPRGPPGSPGEYQRKMPDAPSRWKWNGNHLEIWQSIICKLSRPGLRKNYLTRT